MATKSLPNIGDVITSCAFAYGHYEREDKKLIAVDGTTTKHPVTFDMSEDERVSLAAKSGSIPPRTRTIELGAYDQSRANAKFVVETANMQGGGIGQGAGDVYPDGWYIRARRLNHDGTYDQNNEIIGFYMSGYFTGMIEPKDVHVLGKMQLQFV